MATRTKAAIGRSDTATKTTDTAAGEFSFSDADRARMQAEYEALQREAERYGTSTSTGWVRTIAAGIGSLIAAGTTYYVGMVVTGTICAAAASLVGMGFITWLIAFIGIVITYIATCVVLPVAFVALKDLSFEDLSSTASGAVDSITDSVSSWGNAITGRVGGWFGSKTSEA